jgi:hypothetical protein
MEWPAGALELPAPEPSVPRCTEWPPLFPVLPALGVSCPCTEWPLVAPVHPEPATQVAPQPSLAPQAFPAQTGTQLPVQPEPGWQVMPQSTEPHALPAQPVGVQAGPGSGTEAGSMVSEQPERPISRAAASARRRI